MTSISHAIIGAAIMAKIPDPVIGGSIVFASHFLCDMIPHWDLGTNWRNRPKRVTGTMAIAETLIALFGTFIVFSPLFANKWLLVIGIVMSLLPDWLEAPYYIMLPNPPKIFIQSYKFQSYFHEKLQAPWGIVTQLATIGVFLWVGFWV